MIRVDLLQATDHDVYTKFIHEKVVGIEHTLVWQKLLQKHFGFEPKYLIAWDCQEDVSPQIRGTLPLFYAKSIFGRRLVSLPYAVTGGMVVDPNTSDIRNPLFAEAKKLSIDLSCSFVEVREFGSHQYDNTTAINSITNFSRQLGTSADSLFARLPKSSVRWGIKKSLQSGLICTVGNSAQDLQKLYDLFISTRKFRGMPGYPKAFLQDILTSCSAKIYTAHKEGKPLASMMVLYHQQEMRYAFSGARHERSCLQLQPYHFIFWQAMQDAIKGGYTTFNLGGAGLAQNKGGLLQFKKRWADTVQLVTSHYHINHGGVPATEETQLLRAAQRVWKHVPLPIIHSITPWVIKQFV